MSKLVTALCDHFKSKHIYISTFHPQTNSHCERYNSFIAQSLRAYMNEQHTNWPDLLPGIFMAYRLTPAVSLGISSFQMLFGGEMLHPFDLGLRANLNASKQAE